MTESTLGRTATPAGRLSESSQGPKRPNLAAVARLAGVSVSTASLAFSGSGPVSAATRERVHAAAEQLGYAGPDPRARSLRQGRSGIIAVVLEETVLDAFRDPVKIALLDGIAQETASSGRALLLLPDAGEGPSVMATATMDAVVLISCSPHVNRSVAISRQRAIPVVSLGGTPFDEVPSITLDDRAATTILAQHLWSLGHRRVGVVALPLSSRDRGRLTPEWEAAATVATALDRLAGAREVFGDPEVIVAAGSLVDEGLLAGRELLGSDLAPGNRPTAIIAQSDLLAAGVIRAAEERGLQVPADLSVVGFDGIRLDNVIAHDLTTMVQPATAQGRAAGRMVLAMLDEQRPGSECFTSVFHLGNTTAPPPAG